MTTDLLDLEVTELTELVRTDPQWRQLRATLDGAGLKMATSLLAGFMENEHGECWGAVVTADGRLFEFRKKDEASRLETLVEHRNVEKLRMVFPAVAAAVASLANPGRL